MADRMPCILVDSREQRRWVFSAEHPSRVVTVPKGADYSVEGFELDIGIERKSLNDLVGSLTQGRERFQRSVAELRKRKHCCIIVEASINDVLEHQYRSQVDPSCIMGSVCALCASGVPVFFCGSVRGATAFAEKWLVKCWQRVSMFGTKAPAAAVDVVEGAQKVLKAVGQ